MSVASGLPVVPKLKENTSTSRAATQLKFEVFLVERIGSAEAILQKTQLLWISRPQAIGLALKEDVERLLEKGGCACTDVPRKLVSTKGAAQSVSLLDVGTFVLAIEVVDIHVFFPWA